MKRRVRTHSLVLPAVAALIGLAAAGFLGSPALAKTAAAPRNVSLPTISGTLRQGETLTATNGTWENSPTAFSYRWQRCGTDGTGCANIAAAVRRRYTLTAADVDHTMRVVVTATNADGQASATSRASGVVSADSGPRNTQRPTISGVPRVGEELTADPGTWTGGVSSFAYQWQRCDTVGSNCSDVTGANGRTYGVRAADVGRTLRVEVTARNEAGSTSSTSDRTAVVRSATSPPPPPPPPPSGNRRPTIALLNARLLGRKVYVRVRICDDSRKNVTIIERDSKPGVRSYTRRFATLTPPRPCGVYSRSWIPAPRFRTPGRFTVTLWARDKSGLQSAPVRRVFFR